MGVRLRLGLGLMSINSQFFEEELSTGVVWGWGQIKVGVGVRLRLGSLTTNLEFFEEELNTGVGWGRGQIKVGVGVGNSFSTPD